MPEYVIQRGDDFYRLAQRFGGTCEDWLLANPGINPVTLQIGQKVVLPPILNSKAREQYAELSAGEGNEFAGDHMDDVEMEIEGVHFRIKRIGEGKIPHEIHLIVPRTEIRKIQPQGEQGPCEVQIMLSNVDIVHSPRLMSEGGGTKEAIATTASSATLTPQGQEMGKVQVSSPIPQTSQGEQNPLARTQELGMDIRADRPILFRK